MKRDKIEWKEINTNRAEGCGSLQYIHANADPFTMLFSHVVESWESTNKRNLFLGRQNHCQKLASLPITVLISVQPNGHSLPRQTDLVVKIGTWDHTKNWYYFQNFFLIQFEFNYGIIIWYYKKGFKWYFMNISAFISWKLITVLGMIFDFS